MDSRQKSLTPEEFLPILEEEPEDGGYLEDDRSDEEEHEENHDHLVNQEIYSDQNNDHNYNPQNQDTNEQIVEGPSRRLECQESESLWRPDYNNYRGEHRTYTNLESRNSFDSSYSGMSYNHEQPQVQDEILSQENANSGNAQNTPPSLPMRKKKNVYLPKHIKEGYTQEFVWQREKPQNFNKDRFAFTQENNVGPTQVYSENATELEILESMHPLECAKYIAEQTNIVLRKKSNKITPKGKSRYANVKEMSVEELRLTDAIAIAQGIVKLPRITDFWSRDTMYHNEFISNILRKDRFLQMYSSLHFTEIADAYSAQDRLYKIRHLAEMYKAIFKRNYYPRRELSVDESLELWQGRRLAFRVVIPNKACTEGIEMFIICEAQTAYALDFEYYSGNAIEPYDKVEIEGTDLTYFTTPAKIVLHLAKPYLGNGHTLGLDNLYADPRLYQCLIDNDTDAVGTFRTNRLCLPREVKEIKLSKGEVKVWYKNVSDRKTITALCWQDKKKVCMLSTYHDDTMVTVDDKEGGPSAKKKKPKCCVDYKKAMRGVDLNDQIRSAYTIARPKTKKYYRKMYFNLLDMAILNSFIVFNYHRLEKEKRTFLKFKENLIKQLVWKYKPLLENSQRLPPTITSDTPNRLIPGGHHPRPIGTVQNKGSYRAQRRQCVVCNTQSEQSEDRKKRKQPKKVDLECRLCKAALCPGECWDVYHEEENYKDYQKHVNVSYSILHLNRF